MFEDPAQRYFSANTSPRDRAVFECGIALATDYHQFLGTPFKRSEQAIKALEEAIANSLLAQPYRVQAWAKISEEVRESESPYDYGELTPHNLEVWVVVEYGRVRVRGRLRYVEELGYPLAYIESIEECEK